MKALLLLMILWGFMIGLACGVALQRESFFPAAFCGIVELVMLVAAYFIVTKNL